MTIFKQSERNVQLKQSVKSPAMQETAQNKVQRLVRIFYFPQFSHPETLK